MILIFSNKDTAVQVSQEIHNFLVENRTDYNATHWSDEHKHPTKNEYAVPIHPDLEELAVRMNIEAIIPQSIDVVDKLPADWEIEEL
jgi:hypothetical protein